MKDALNKIIHKCRETLGNLSSYQLDVYSSGAAFFIFISIIPFILIVMYIVPYLSFTQTDVINVIDRLIPDDFYIATEALIKGLYNRSNAILPISVIALLWSSSRGIMAITKGLNRLHYVEENRNYFIVRAICMLYTVLLVAGVVLLVVLGVFGKRILRLIDLYFDQLHDTAAVIYQYSDIATIIVLFLLFLFMYTFLPAKHMIIRAQMPGALLASLVWWGFTELFSYYTLHFNAYSMYGSLSMVVILLVWIYAGMYFFFFGGWLNYRMSLR